MIECTQASLTPSPNPTAKRSAPAPANQARREGEAPAREEAAGGLVKNKFLVRRRKWKRRKLHIRRILRYRRVYQIQLLSQRAKVEVPKGRSKSGKPTLQRRKRLFLPPDGSRNAKDCREVNQN